jgi:DinB superfamily
MSSVKEKLSEQITSAATRYVQDLMAIPHEQLGTSPMGQARAAYDFTYECVFVNKRIAARMRGDDPGPWPFEGWVTAPPEFKNQAMAASELTASTQLIVDAFNAIDESELHRQIETPGGHTTPIEMALMAALHLSHHDGQLNYIQSLHGDGQMHWQ